MFKVGDKVKVTGGTYAGREGVISQVNTTNHRVKLPSGYQVNISRWNLQKIEEPKPEPKSVLSGLSKSDFKIGQKVKRVYRSNNGPAVGTTGVVKHFEYKDVGVLWDGWRGGHDLILGSSGRKGWYVPPSDIEHLVEAPKHSTRGYIVAVEKDGRYAPATTPKEYSTEEQALAVAQSMADRHGGKFYVLKPVAIAERPLVPKSQVTRI